VGATTQAILSLVLPARYAILPTLILLIHTIVSTVHSAITFTKPLPAPSFHSTTVPGRTSSHIPSSFTTSITPFSNPARQGVVALHLGVRYSHPLGIFAPGVKEIGAHFQKCNTALFEAAKAYGCMGSTSWRSTGQDTNNTMMTVYYFKHVEGLHRFAHDDVHRKAWDWFDKGCPSEKGNGKKGKGYIGVYHETFETKAGGWETIAADMPPTLLGAGSVLVEDGEGEEVWVNPLVELRGEMFKGQWARMDKGKSPWEKYVSPMEAEVEG
jgi:hypothetical protein